MHNLHFLIHPSNDSSYISRISYGPSVFSHHYQLSQPDYWSHLPALLNDRLIYFTLPLLSWHSKDFSHFPFHFQLQTFKCFHYYQAFIDCMLSSTSAESAIIISFCTLWYKQHGMQTRPSYLSCSLPCWSICNLLTPLVDMTPKDIVLYCNATKASSSHYIHRSFRRWRLRAFPFTCVLLASFVHMCQFTMYDYTDLKVHDIVITWLVTQHVMRLIQ